MMDQRPNATVDWFGDKVMLTLEKGCKVGIRAVVLQTEAQAKVNIGEPFEHADGSVRGQIDSGVMQSSTRARIFPDPGLPLNAEASVESPQEYAAAQEAIRAFLLPAAMTVSQHVGAIMQIAHRTTS